MINQPAIPEHGDYSIFFWSSGQGHFNEEYFNRLKLPVHRKDATSESIIAMKIAWPCYAASDDDRS
jgi:hypothetical protein